MPTTPEWTDLGLRLLGALVAGFAIGMDRGEHGRPAGIRTTMLVSLAACVAMMQANILLPTAGKQADSFGVLDLMRLPLGILTGMGFIGAGAILRRDNLVIGVTTAATLWFVTVIGLCFGGGQMTLGWVSTALAFFILAGVRWIELRTKRDQRVKLAVVTQEPGPSDEDIRSLVQAEGFKIDAYSVVYQPDGPSRAATYTLHRRGLPSETKPPLAVNALAGRPGVARVAWTPQ